MLPALSILPATAVLEMTWACNHACLFCSCPWFDMARGDARPPEEMPVSEWKELVETFARAGVTSFCFTGGEPLLKKGLLELIAFTARLTAHHIETVGGALKQQDAPPSLYLLSNGKAVTDEILEMCRDLNIALSVSLPGVETFGEHTRGNQPVENVLHIFRKASAMGITTTAGITVTRRNFHELYETIAMALIAGASQILLNRFMPGGRGLANRDLELSVEQIRQIPEIAEAVLAKANRKGHIGTEYPRCLVDPERFTHIKVGTRCSAASDFFVVSPSGQLRVCNHSPIDLAHWRDYEQLKDHPYWQQFVRKDWLPSGCEGCRHIGITCDGGCREAAHVSCGDVSGPDPVFRGLAPQRQ
ncbi:MAG: radical SAM protein [Kiritimatiellaeota bacterium]|nr:radical SAM protein [Kiritimatiellota bacterium]